MPSFVSPAGKDEPAEAAGQPAAPTEQHRELCGGDRTVPHLDYGGGDRIVSFYQTFIETYT